MVIFQLKSRGKVANHPLLLIITSHSLQRTVKRKIALGLFITQRSQTFISLVGFEGNGSDYDLVVQSSKSGSNEWSNPENPLCNKKMHYITNFRKFQNLTIIIFKNLKRNITYVVIPAKIFVENDGSTETSSRVDTGASDWDGGQVHQEHSESNGQRCQNLIIPPTW